MDSRDYLQFTNRMAVFFKQPKFFPNTYDFIAFIFIVTLLTLIVTGFQATNQSLAKLALAPVTLDPYNLPKYALYTTLRMFSAVLLSLIFTFTVATLAAKSKRAEVIIIPVLDVLQSVPVLGFLTFTVAFFMGLFPGREAGAELAAIFAVFTAQAWNMAFSFYQSLRAVPQDMRDVSGQFCLNGWQTFWRLEVPFAIPGLTWNTMMSMSGSWFFIVAAEAISVGNTQINLPGIGSWLGLAISKMDLQAVGLAILTMAVVILAYDQLIFRPIVAWSDKFNMGQTARQIQPRSWVYDILRRTKVLGVMMRPLRALGYKILCIRWSNDTHKHHDVSFVAPVWVEKSFDTIWYIVLGAFVAGCVFYVMHYLQATLTIANVTVVIVLGLITLLRVMLMVLLASLIWVPIGVWVGLRPRMVAWVQPLALFLSAFPANILFPLVVIVIVYFNLNPDIWLSPLIVLGTQWYIFFNVIAGVSAYPNDLQEAAQIYQVRSWLWWRRVMLPGVLPYYVTGAITAAGGSWNASIVAEVVSWGSIKLQAHGLGAYIADATAAGNFHKVVLGVTVMSVFVVCINRAVWRRLHDYAARLAGMEA